MDGGTATGLQGSSVPDDLRASPSGESHDAVRHLGEDCRRRKGTASRPLSAYQRQDRVGTATLGYVDGVLRKLHSYSYCDIRDISASVELTTNLSIKQQPVSQHQVRIILSNSRLFTDLLNKFRSI